MQYVNTRGGGGDHLSAVDFLYVMQCCGSGSGSAWIRIGFGRLDPDPDPGRQKRPKKIEKEEEM